MADPVGKLKPQEIDMLAMAFVDASKTLTQALGGLPGDWAAAMALAAKVAEQAATVHPASEAPTLKMIKEAVARHGQFLADTAANTRSKIAAREGTAN